MSKFLCFINLNRLPCQLARELKECMKIRNRDDVRNDMPLHMYQWQSNWPWDRAFRLTFSHIFQEFQSFVVLTSQNKALAEFCKFRDSEPLLFKVNLKRQPD